MRIAFVNQDAGIGPERKKGAAIHLRAMRRAFEQLGATILAIDSPDAERVEAALLDHARTAEIDLIYERYSGRGYAASRVARDRDIPHVLEVNAPLVEESHRYRPDARLSVDREAELELFTRAHIVAVSEALKVYAIERGAQPARVWVFPNAVDSDLFRPRVDDSVRDQLVPRDRFVIGMHGRLREWHNFGMLVNATERLISEGEPVFLLLAGYGHGVEQLERLPSGTYAQLPWCSHEEVAQIVACFDVLPLTYEPQESFYFSPLKLAEAMACGVVPVVPDLGDLPRRVTHGVNGAIYPAGNEGALTDVLRDLLGNPEETDKLRSNATATARESTWLNLAERILEKLGRGVH